MPPHENIRPEICTESLYNSYYRVYVTYSKYGANIYPVCFSRSTDFGLTWSAPVIVANLIGLSEWHTTPDIAYGSSGLYITFEQPGWNGSSYTNQVYVIKSTNFGTTWNAEIQLTSSSLDCYHPRIAVASNGTIMVAYTRDYGGANADIESSYSTDGGATWDPLYLPWTGSHEGEVELAVSTSNGRFHAAYWHELYEIWYSWAYATNPELGWSSPAIIVNDSSNITPYMRPAVCANPTLPVDQEACIAWTESRFVYDVIFDHPPICGDGLVEGEEQCDDGNTLNADCCSATCMF
jgi:cysteine-rich repeat protein